MNGSDSQSGVESWKPVGASFFVKKKSGLDNGVSIMGLSLCMESIGTRSSRLEAGGWAEKKVHYTAAVPPTQKEVPPTAIDWLNEAAAADAIRWQPEGGWGTVGGPEAIRKAALHCRCL